MLYYLYNIYYIVYIILAKKSVKYNQIKIIYTYNTTDTMNRTKTYDFKMYLKILKL